jgi:hypothetical protein
MSALLAAALAFLRRAAFFAALLPPAGAPPLSCTPSLPEATRFSAARGCDDTSAGADVVTSAVSVTLFTAIFWSGTVGGTAA